MSFISRFGSEMEERGICHSEPPAEVWGSIGEVEECHRWRRGRRTDGVGGCAGRANGLETAEKSEGMWSVLPQHRHFQLNYHVGQFISVQFNLVQVCYVQTSNDHC